LVTGRASAKMPVNIDTGMRAGPRADRIQGVRVEVDGAMVPFPDQMPERFAQVVTGFLAS